MKQEGFIFVLKFTKSGLTASTKTLFFPSEDQKYEISRAKEYCSVMTEKKHYVGEEGNIKNSSE
jgi:hypothetical protein